MEETLRSALTDHRSLSIIGMSKNAGKTTVLNRLIALSAQDARTLALTSIGRDGETTDIVTGTEKPGIWVRAGTLIATAADMLRLGDITPEILLTTGMYTPLGEVAVLRALSDGQVQLAGPSMNEQLTRLVGLLQAQGAEIVLIDGALSRKSLAAPAVSEATILCTGAAYSADMEQVIADTAFACTLLTLPQSAGDHPRRHLLEGAATDTALGRLPLRDGDEITARDSSCLLLGKAMYARLARRGIRLTVKRPSTLCCVCINPRAPSGAGFDPTAFRARMQAAVPVPVLNVRESQ